MVDLGCAAVRDSRARGQGSHPAGASLVIADLAHARRLIEDCCRNGRDNIETIELIMGIYESARTGEPWIWTHFRHEEVAMEPEIYP